MSHGISQPDPFGKKPALGDGVLPLGSTNTSVWDAPIFGKSIPFDELVDLVEEEFGHDTAQRVERKPVAAPETRIATSDAAAPARTASQATPPLPPTRPSPK